MFTIGSWWFNPSNRLTRLCIKQRTTSACPLQHATNKGVRPAIFWGLCWSLLHGRSLSSQELPYWGVVAFSTPCIKAIWWGWFTYNARIGARNGYCYSFDVSTNSNFEVSLYRHLWGFALKVYPLSAIRQPNTLKSLCQSFSSKHPVWHPMVNAQWLQGLNYCLPRIGDVEICLKDMVYHMIPCGHPTRQQPNGLLAGPWYLSNTPAATKMTIAVESKHTVCQ